MKDELVKPLFDEMECTQSAVANWPQMLLRHVMGFKKYFTEVMYTGVVFQIAKKHLMQLLPSHDAINMHKSDAISQYCVSCAACDAFLFTLLSIKTL